MLDKLWSKNRGANHHYKRACTSTCYIIREGLTDIGNFYYDKPCIIGNDVWIAAGAIVNRGVTIGNGAVIGAGAVVTHDVEPYSIVVGNPAHELKKRFSDDFIRRLNVTEWWNLPAEEIKENAVLFSSDLTEETLTEIERICLKLK